MNSLTDAGFKLICSSETCRLEAYRDDAGIWTVGWGHVGPEVIPGLVWTQDQADDQFKADLKYFSNGVSVLVDQPLNDNEFSALVSFAFNNGCGALATSELLKLVDSGEFALAADEFPKWIHIHKNGVKIVESGLITRRAAEQALFLTKVVP